MNLKIASVSHEAAKFAAENYHYSKCLPVSRLIKYGVWENNKFIGVVIFSKGASPFLGKSLNLTNIEVCELTRIALTSHQSNVTEIIAKTLKILKSSNPGLRAVISFADPKQGHKGAIYQAGNWFYTGSSAEVTEYFIDGRWRHVRGIYHRPEREIAPIRKSPGKLRYVYPLDKAMRRKVGKLSLDYPSAVEGLEASYDNSVVGVQVQSLPTAQSK